MNIAYKFLIGGLVVIGLLAWGASAWENRRDRRSNYHRYMGDDE